MKAINKEDRQKEIDDIKKQIQELETFYNPEFKCDRREVRHFITAIPVATSVDFTKKITVYTVGIIKCKKYNFYADINYQKYK